VKRARLLFLLLLVHTLDKRQRRMYD
jgi:hypothetical protein